MVELRGAVAAAGALPTACRADPGEVAALVAHDPPVAVVAVGADAAALRHRLDPLGLDHGPEVIELEELTGSGGRFDAAAARRLRALIDRRDLRARASELEAVAADLAIARRREGDAAALDTLRRLAMAAEYRDDNTREHTERVGDLAARLARQCGHDTRTVWLVRQAAPLHDLGKIAVPDTVLLKPGSLTSEEFEVVKTHAVLGARVLAGSDSELLVDRRAGGALAPRALGRQRLPRRPGRRGDPARGPSRARRRRLRRAGARAPVQGVVDRGGGGGGDPARRGHAVRPPGGGGVRGARRRRLGRPSTSEIHPRPRAARREAAGVVPP